MAKSLSTRFGLQRWSADSDTQQRSEFDNDAAQLDTLAAKAGHGTIGARPAAAAAWADSYWLITDATGGGVVGTLYFCDGSTWVATIAPRSQGLATNRPASALATRQYYKTDSDLFSIDDGTAWHDFPSKAVTDAAYAPLSVTSAWTAYTPTLTGITIGNGTINAAYKLNGKTLHLRIQVVLGTTSSVTGALTASLPAATTGIAAGQRALAVLSVAGAFYTGFFLVSSGGTTGALYGPTSSASTATVPVDATHPAAWGTNGDFEVNATLEVA